MTKPKLDRVQILIDFIAVVFAVLLALFLNNWRESVSTERVVQKVMESIESEVKSNTEILTRTVVYRKGLVDDLIGRKHLVLSSPVSEFEIDVENDTELEKFWRETIPFSMSRVITRLQVKRAKERRILILNDLVLKLAVENDTLKLYGPTNIQLRTANISNRSWEIAQATGALVEMDIEVVDLLSQINNLIGQYQETSDMAIQMIYRGEPEIISVMQDMAYFENELIKTNELLLDYVLPRKLE